MPAPREARLPKWAQDELNHLRNRVETLTKMANAGPEDSNTFASHLGSQVQRPLGADPMIDFYLDEVKCFRPGHLSARVTERYGSKHLEIMSNGGGALIIEPFSSNVVAIQVLKS